MIRIQLFSFLASMALLVFIVEMVRRKRLKEQYSLLWIFGAIGLVLLSAWPGLLDKLAPLCGIAYPPAVLFLGGLFLLVLLSLHFSMVISRLSEQNRILAQKLAVIEMDKEDIQNNA